MRTMKLDTPSTPCSQRAFEILEEMSNGGNVPYDLLSVGYLVGKMFDEFVGQKQKKDKKDE